MYVVMRFGGLAKLKKMKIAYLKAIICKTSPLVCPRYAFLTPLAE